MSDQKTDIPYGTLDLLILKTLDTIGPAHGYRIARRIEQVAENLLRLNQGSIYPALIRLEQQGWIRTQWGILGNKARSKVLLADQERAEATEHRSLGLGKSDRLSGTVPGSESMTSRAMTARVLALFRRRKLDRELNDEIAAHLELAEHDALAAGLTPEEAHRAARRNFGGIEEMKEDHRDHRSVVWMDNLQKDFRYGLSSLGRDPGFATVAIGLLALGIGANSAMFSIVDAVLLKPLPFPEPERMVRVREAPPEGRNPTTTLTFLDWKRQTDLFEALSAECPIRAAVMTSGYPARIAGKQVSADYFKVFGVSPQLGRPFATGEDQPGAASVVILSHAFWQAQFAGDPGVLNRDLTLDGEPHRIIGVLPAGSFDRDEAMFWEPLIFAKDQLNRGPHWLTPIGRLRSGVSIQRAQAKMTALRASLNAVIYQKDWGFAVDPFAQLLVGDTLRRSIYLTFGAVVMVLLIACANVANLALAKGATRRKEMALRTALGASRGRLIAQLLTESLVLSILGGVAGIALGALLLRVATPLLAASLPFTADLKLDLRVLSFAAAAVLAVLILSGLLPSLQTSFGTLSNALNQSSRGTSGSNAAVRRTIVVAEVAASVVLICGAALLFKSLAKLQQVDTGVRIDHVITMSTDLPSATYPTPASAARFYENLVQRLRRVPGVEQASVSQSLPLQGVQWGEYMTLPGVAQPLVVRLKLVDPWYFSTLRIPIEEGRAIEQRDRSGAAQVVVVNQEVGRVLSKAFGVASPVGRTVAIDVPGYGTIPESRVNMQIIGVIRSEHTSRLDEAPELVAYLPLAQAPRQDIKVVVWTRSGPSMAMPGIREAVQQIDPHLPLGDVKTMEQVKEESTLQARQPTWVLGAFAGVAALLAALGLYGVLANAVTQQRREIGIRMAVGAGSSDVLFHVLRSAFSMLILGLAGGLVGAFALTRLLKSLLFQVSALDPVAIITACGLMAFVGMLAAWIPASRATHVDPMTVLRDEG